MLPFTYAARNLLRDPSKLIQKVGGSCVVVMLILLAGSFNEGMDSVLSGTGSPRNVILLGAGSEESTERSEVAVQAESLATAGIPGIEHRLGTPSVSGEVHYMGNLFLPDGRKAQALLRGITQAAFEVHRQARILEGRYPGSGEVLVGRLAHHTLGVDASELTLGNTLVFEDQPFTIVGIFAGPGSVLESEVWFDRNDLMTLTQRDSLSCVVIRLEDERFFANADLFCKQRLDLELTAIRESDYYRKLSQFYAPIRGMTWLTAFLVAAGAVFGGLNMLYASFASRTRELATLQAVGFSRPGIYFSLVQESLLATLSGTLLAAFLAVFLMESLVVNFSMGSFQLTLSASTTGAGLLAGTLLGLAGSVPPAIRCLGMPLPTALRS